MPSVVLPDPRDAAKLWLAKAQENVQAAAACCPYFPNAVANRSYYAAFQAVVALFRIHRLEHKLKRGDDGGEPRYNHVRVQEEFLSPSAPGNVAREVKVAFMGLKVERIRADYEEVDVEVTKAKECVAKADRVVRGIDPLVRRVTTTR